MYTLMSRYVSFSIKFLLTKFTFEWLLFRMCALVFNQLFISSRSFLTKITFGWLHFRMHILCSIKFPSRSEQSPILRKSFAPKRLIFWHSHLQHILHATHSVHPHIARHTVWHLLFGGTLYVFIEVSISIKSVLTKFTFEFLLFIICALVFNQLSIPRKSFLTKLTFQQNILWQKLHLFVFLTLYTQ